MTTYLLINLASISIPFIYSFHPRLQFHKTWFALWPAILITGVLFIAWDILFTEWGVWGFNPRYLLGVDLLNLPVEEWLFFICIPYACVFTYASLSKLTEKDLLAKYTRTITWALIFALAVIALFNLNRAYTATTFLATSVFLILQLYLFKSNFLGRFYLAYLAILIPFFIVNGILTGSFIEEQVVWYSNSENLGLRIFTIPVEDFIYSLLLQLMNVTLYENFLKKK